MVEMNLHGDDENEIPLMTKAGKNEILYET